MPQAYFVENVRISNVKNSQYKMHEIFINILLNEVDKSVFMPASISFLAKENPLDDGLVGIFFRVIKLCFVLIKQHR